MITTVRESGTTDTHSISAYYFDDPLWDGAALCCFKMYGRCMLYCLVQSLYKAALLFLLLGAGCITSRYCDNTTQPWFYRQLNGTTTSAIEARICHSNEFSVGSTLVDQLELYIQLLTCNNNDV